jgi:hypothetical protein
MDTEGRGSTPGKIISPSRNETLAVPMDIDAVAADKTFSPNNKGAAAIPIDTSNPPEKSKAPTASKSTTPKGKKKQKEKEATKAKESGTGKTLPNSNRITTKATNLIQNDGNDGDKRLHLSDDPASDEEFDYMYDKRDGYFYRGTLDIKSRRYFNKTKVPDISVIDDATLTACKKEPNNWISPGLGDPWDNPPPKNLTTKVKCLYEQLNRPFCLTYCLASALFYCKFEQEAYLLAKQAIDLAALNMRYQLERIKEFMPNLVPLIGEPTIFNKRSTSNSRKKRAITWDKLFDDVTRYPTLVIPIRQCGKINHAVCVVDDLIFDASTPFALRLTMDSVNWIFQEENTEIFVAYRFENKVSPTGQKIKGIYNRPLKFNWNNPKKKPPMAKRPIPNKTYDIDIDIELKHHTEPSNPTNTTSTYTPSTMQIELQCDVAATPCVAPRSMTVEVKCHIQRSNDVESGFQRNVQVDPRVQAVVKHMFRKDIRADDIIETWAGRSTKKTAREVPCYECKRNKRIRAVAHYLLRDKTYGLHDTRVVDEPNTTDDGEPYGLHDTRVVDEPNTTDDEEPDVWL